MTDVKGKSVVNLFDDDSLYYEDRDERLEKLTQFEYAETRFGFINDHFGFRKGKVHLLLGTTGSGKSTLTRSLLLDVAKHHKVLLWSTEESREETIDMLAKRNVGGEFLKNIKFIDEDKLIQNANLKLTDVDELLRIIGAQVINFGAELIILDNITTSQFYSNYEVQLQLINGIRSLVQFLEVPVLIVAHTQKSVKDDQRDLIGPNDIMGPKTLADKAQYQYVYQKFVLPGFGGDGSQGVIRVVKGRGVGNIGNIYFLRFNFDTLEYTSDYKVVFNDFKELFKRRAKLGDK